MKYIHYVPILPTKWLEKWASSESKRFCNRCDAIVVPSKQMKAGLLDYEVSSPIEVIPTGVDPYSPTEENLQFFSVSNKLFVSSQKNRDE